MKAGTSVELGFRKPGKDAGGPGTLGGCPGPEDAGATWHPTRTPAPGAPREGALGRKGGGRELSVNASPWREAHRQAGGRGPPALWGVLASLEAGFPSEEESGWGAYVAREVTQSQGLWCQKPDVCRFLSAERERGAAGQRRRDGQHQGRGRTDASQRREGRAPRRVGGAWGRDRTRDPLGEPGPRAVRGRCLSASAHGRDEARSRAGAGLRQHREGVLPPNKEFRHQ
ncbi:uncharacterized protein LOC130679631 [Manis pentadactyla]|uniref:uncharacterized protein LOC130679631 n=1 Tax=Manis pentadactyla TaxID=143292 RepID=UPI00255C50F7|nr:uncharacterized protein LOC130679631 [Manis pentadactyla]